MAKQAVSNKGRADYIVAVAWNILLAYLVYMLCRVAYVGENWSTLAAGWPSLRMGDLLAGGLRFDTAAIFYTHLPYLLMMLLPLALPLRRRRGYQLTAKWLYMIVNSLAVVVNLCDCVYSQYTGRRTTSTFFSEFQNDSNLAGIVAIELWHHWYLVLAGIALIALLWKGYRMPTPIKPYKLRAGWRLLLPLFDVLLLAAVGVLCVIGMRGGASKAVRPIAISNANQYVNSPSEAAIVLNTPFSLIRTAGKTSFTNPSYYDEQELSQIYSPLHNSNAVSDSLSLAKPMPNKNVVVLIVESLASEYIGSFNEYKGYTPFLDSLIGESLTFRQSLANGRKSIDGMPSILSGIPMFVEPFFVTPYGLNKVSGLAGELGRKGYATAFFHGAENGSMGFQAFARATGFARYYGRTEYDADSRFDGETDFDGTWAIWDEPFLQYYATVMSDMPQPFMTAVFTASSHHPFVVPEKYRDSLREEGHPMYTCIRYTDMALRHFFETAARQPWYDNTLFVITADHTNHSEQECYLTDIGRYRVPIIFFDPSGTLPKGRMDAVAQQTDIMPTLLGALGYDNPYLAYGIDLLATPTDSTWAVNYNGGIYQYVEGDFLLQFDGANSVALYDMATDPLLRSNLKSASAQSERLSHMERRLKAIIQSYMDRMINNKLTVDE